MPEVVVISGASAGVGRATAREFARHGARIGLLARGREGLEGARRDVESLGGKALVLPTDVADAEAVEEAARRAEEELGPIDIWVNDAMSSVFSPFAHITPEEYKRATEVTYLGFVYGTMSALKRMRQRDRGTIVQVGSALSYRAIPLQAPYCGAKVAIRGFTDSVRTELMHEKSNVHITMVQLPAHNTPQFGWSRTKLPNHPQPVPSIYQPEVKHLPDPPLPYFDSDKVDAGAEAYSKLSMPDAPIGLGSYAATLALAAMGDEDRAAERPWIPLALAAKVVLDAAQAGKLSVDQWTKHRAFCFWCLIAAGATFATVPLVIPETRVALRHLSQGPS